MSESDRDLVRAVRRGDRDAFGGLVRAYQGRLFGLVLLMAREPAAAEEIVQDAFVRAYTRIHYFDDARPFYPWIASIAVRLTQNWLRQHNRTVIREGTPIESAAEPRTEAPQPDRLIDSERGRDLWQAVAALPSGERTAVMLHYRDELALGDIASALGVTTGTIKTLLFRARQKLRARLDPDLFDQETQR